MDHRALAELVMKVRTVFFFLHDLDESYEAESKPAREVVDGFFERRFGIRPEQTAQGVLPFLQAKTLVWFLFPILSLLRDEEEGLPVAPPEAWRVTIQPAGSRPATVATQLKVMRNAIAHLLDHKPGATGVDLDGWTFQARNGRVVFEDLDGLVACFSALLARATQRAIALIEEDPGR